MNIEDLIKPIQVDTTTYHIRDADEDEDEYHDFVVVATYPRADRSEVTLGYIDQGYIDHQVGQHLRFIAENYCGLPIAFGADALRAIASFVDIVNFADDQGDLSR